MKWISVKDQLPKHGHHVLIFISNRVEIGRFLSSKWFVESYEEHECLQPTEKVTHWAKFEYPQPKSNI